MIVLPFNWLGFGIMIFYAALVVAFVFFLGWLLEGNDGRPGTTGPLGKLMAKLNKKVYQENNHHIIYEIKLWDEIKMARGLIFSTPLSELKGVYAKIRDGIIPILPLKLTRLKIWRIRRKIFAKVEDNLLTKFEKQTKISTILHLQKELKAF